jgi:hypothetical protein
MQNTRINTGDVAIARQQQQNQGERPKNSRGAARKIALEGTRLNARG